MKEIQDFDSIQIKLASPEQIKSWSYGEVKKPETINYRTLRPERDGLFCEKIFGTTKEWECYCGKFKSIRYKGVVCDRCGVEVTHFRVRRERMGHIDLASPVSHIWYYRSVPSRMSLLLDVSRSSLQSILYYEKYIVTHPGDTPLKYKQILSEEEYYEYKQKFGEAFSASMGAEAIKVLLENLDLEALSNELRAQMRERGNKSDKRLIKRIEVAENFKNSDNKPEWMILTVIPVIPPDLRPMVQLDGGRFATSDLNDLYRRVINRNNRLKRLTSLNAPDIIIRNEKRMLQEAVDALFDNSKKKRVVKGAANRALKSLSDMLKGKQGRFRQNLLGKRVDYSGRSVIVVGPELKLHQCGLPAKMALELYKPFIMKKLVLTNAANNIKKAKTLVEQEKDEVWKILDSVVKEHPVLLNRAPTLHRLGIQAFEPVLVEGKAIKLHPLVCHAYNADFDGDQMAVHVPLTQAAQLECWTLMLSASNLLDPANGKPIVFPSQDMILGINYLTRVKEGDKGEGKYFDNISEVEKAIAFKSISYNALIKFKLPYGEVVDTTAGRLIFNSKLPKDIPYQNKCFNDKELKLLIGDAINRAKDSVVVSMLDAIKDIGYKYATLFGATIGLSDMLIPKSKEKLMDEAEKKQAEIRKQYKAGHITSDERYNRIIELWTETNEKLTEDLMSELREDQKGFNSLFLMTDSGARGSKTQIRQLGAMRGLMARPSGDIIEFPIKSNFKEGLSIIEFFISTNGARKGLSDTALKTAEAGYLTRRLVDISQDVVVNEDDCGTINGIVKSAIKKGDEIIESLSSRIIGSYTLENVYDPLTREIIIEENKEITNEIGKRIEEAGVESVYVRTVLTCESKHGVCKKCYGRNLATNKPVEIGEAVGIIAAQSIGQPGTQLTMRNFHVGGTANIGVENNTISLSHDIYLDHIKGNVIESEDKVRIMPRKGYFVINRILRTIDLSKKDKTLLVEDGQRVFKEQVLYRAKDKSEVKSVDVGLVKLFKNKMLIVSAAQRIEIPIGSTIKVKENTIIEENQVMAEFDPFIEPIISEVSGVVKFVDIKLGSSLREETNPDSGAIEKKITDQLNISETLQPRIVIMDSKKKELGSYALSGGTYLSVEDGQRVKTGYILAKRSKESVKTRDITGGLPRVGELFEARRHPDAAVLAQISGTVRFESVAKGKRVIVVEDDYGYKAKHIVALKDHLLVRDGDIVEAGEKISDGPVDPHHILSILGEDELQTFLLDEVQQVYRLQGVDINDKHLGVVVRQMLRKVEILKVGDTSFIQGEHVDKTSFNEENKRVTREGGEAAVAKSLLLGITKASLSIDSFISAASFQETTKVLTNAAIAGKKDELRGLKENVIIGHLIPAGTGMRTYRNIEIIPKVQEKNITEEVSVSENKLGEE